MSKVWGTPTWNLLHCIPEKIDETYFNNNKDKVIMIINSILIGLPCPDCSSHSLKLFNKSKIPPIDINQGDKIIFHEIKKEDFKNY